MKRPSDVPESYTYVIVDVSIQVPVWTHDPAEAPAVAEFVVSEEIKNNKTLKGCKARAMCWKVGDDE